MKWLEKVKKYKVYILVVLLIVSVQTCFIVQKEGYHLDELLSFEMSNAEYNPWIIPTRPVGRLAKFMHEEVEADTLRETFANLKDIVADVLQNGRNSKLLSYEADEYEEPVWLSRQQFRDYLTTGKGDRFNYFSVWYNVRSDVHPPAHYFLLHTICSLFPGKLTAAMGCVINLLTLAGCIVLFIKTGALLDQHKITQEGFGVKLGIAAAVMYGFSHAAIATTLLVRMYGLQTLFCVALFYLHMRKWLLKDFDKKNFWLIAVTMLGFLTQYFFLFYCMVLALVTVVCLFVYKRKKELLIYIRSMVIAGILGVAAFPFSLEHIIVGSRGVEAWGTLKDSIIEYINRLRTYGEILLNRCFGNWVIGLVLVTVSLAWGIYLFRKKKEYRVFLAVFYLPALGYFLLVAKMAPMFVDRYLMAGFPFVISWLAFLICCFVQALPKWRKQTLCFLVAAFAIFHVFTYDGKYLYKGYKEQLQIAEQCGELPCICVCEGAIYYDNLLEFMEYEKTLLTTPAELLNRTDTAEIEQMQEVVLLVKSIIPQETLEEILEQYQWEIREVLMEDSVYGDDVLLCGKAVEKP